LVTDSITLHLQIGESLLEPFLEAANAYQKGIFAVLKTSFKPNSIIENLESLNNRPHWEEVAELVKKWGADLIGENGYSSLGAVVGATYPKEMKRAREILPNSWFLVPGYGAQGGGAADAVLGADKNGLGIVVNSSRGITAAHLKGPFETNLKEGIGFEKIAKKAARFSRNELNQVLRRFTPQI
jgi:orotidine-5'-phosphate decarboxylase